MHSEDTEKMGHKNRDTPHPMGTPQTKQLPPTHDNTMEKCKKTSDKPQIPLHETRGAD